jgi:hypothetical protein
VGPVEPLCERVEIARVQVAALSEVLAHKPHYAKRISSDVGQGALPSPTDPNEERGHHPVQDAPDTVPLVPVDH